METLPFVRIKPNIVPHKRGSTIRKQIIRNCFFVGENQIIVVEKCKKDVL